MHTHIHFQSDTIFSNHYIFIKIQISKIIFLNVYTITTAGTPCIFLESKNSLNVLSVVPSRSFETCHSQSPKKSKKDDKNRDFSCGETEQIKISKLYMRLSIIFLSTLTEHESVVSQASERRISPFENKYISNQCRRILRIFA